MTYYKGYIVSKSNLKKSNYSNTLGFFSGYIPKMDNIYYLLNIPYDLKDFLKKVILKGYDEKKHEIEIIDNDLISCFDNKLKKENSEEITKINENINGTFIIYEIVKDMDGNLFGRELYTNSLFPIFNSKSEKINYRLIIKSKNNYSINTDIAIDVLFDMEVSSLLKCDNIIVGNTVANLNDYNSYMNMFNNKRFFKKREEKELDNYKKKIISLSQNNVFKEDFIIEKKENNIRKNDYYQSIETSLMEDIEYDLLKLKTIDSNLYLNYKNRFEELINNYVDKKNLALLLGEIEFSLMFKKRNVEDILDFIKEIKKEYLNNIINNQNNKTNIDLNKLDKITELFLKVKDKYDYKNQREVLNNLAFLYLMEVYENKDIIDILELKNSYFKNYLKSIIIWINTLIELDIIKCNYIISLNDELNISNVFEMIKNIEFKSNEKLKDKILKL